MLRDAELPEGAVAVTEHQTAGRGRSGRSWSDVAGRSLLLSLLLRPPAGRPVEQLSLVVGLAVAEAIEATAELAAAVKWPNDVLVEGGKVAGVLLESSGATVICGIGVNVDQAEAELPAATRLPSGSLRVATGRAHDRARAARRRPRGCSSGATTRGSTEVSRRSSPSSSAATRSAARP